MPSILARAVAFVAPSVRAVLGADALAARFARTLLALDVDDTIGGLCEVLADGPDAELADVASELLVMGGTAEDGWTTPTLPRPLLLALYDLGVLESEPEADGGLVVFTGFGSRARIQAAVAS